MTPHDNPEGFLAVLAGIGAAVGVGKLLAAAEPITIRILAGRFIVSAGLGCAAGSVIYLVPEANSVLLYGAAAGISSLGTSALEALVKKYTGDPK